MSDNCNFGDSDAQYHGSQLENGDDVNYLEQNDENKFIELFEENEMSRPKSFSFVAQGDRRIQNLLARSLTFEGKNSGTIRRLVLPLLMVHRNYSEFKEDIKLIMHASDNSFMFFRNNEIDANDGESLLAERNLHSVFHYNLLERISFYRSDHGAFNKNPNESLGEDIMNLKTNVSEHGELVSSDNKKALGKVKNNKSGNSVGKITKLLNFVFKKRSQTSTDTMCNDDTKAEDDMPIPSSDDSGEEQNECYMSFDYRSGLHRRSESFHFKTKLSHMRKISKFIGTKFPHHNRVKSSTLVTDLPRLDKRANILTRALLSDLMHFVPYMYRSKELNIVYSTYIHGHSLKTLYRNCHNFSSGHYLFLIRESTGTVFGALLSHAPELSHVRYYGDPSCVVFRCDKNKGTIVYRWSQILDYFIHCDPEFMIIGGCQGSGAAMFLDDNLLRGRSTKSDTFMSERLSDNEDFIIIGLELYTLGDNTPSDSSRSFFFKPD